MENEDLIVILADGDFPSSPQALDVLGNATYLCCCDNAGKRYIDWLEASHKQPASDTRHRYRYPDAIVGDGDSLPLSFKEKYAAVYHQVDEQDFNDLTKATRFVMERFLHSPAPIHITYLGVTGKREDHTIANIGFIAFFKHKLRIEPTLVTDYGIFTFHVGNATLKTFPRQQVSIFNLSCTRLSSRNLKWESYPYKELWQGALNEALGDEIVFSADGEYVVFRTHLPKI